MAPKPRPAAAPAAPATGAAAAGGDGAADGDKRTPTAYEQRVYRLCSAIPKGRVTTYGELAKALDPPSSARAVGQAMRRNPFAPRVPCHRVVAANMEIGGFTGSWGPEAASVKRKRAMLIEEGVPFGGDGRVGRACLVRAEELARLAAGKKGLAGGKGGAGE
ncbi:hypothetical protein Rsub_07941 [Raphidocelis subcapitata]|uniref:Methylated-DNA--protein-cysteine methyltransferase n=1 Tax=Raphidocelis subcapitata TaxID=307507 RepID=A0A2V0P5V8_9CHLO|nr:hypothetical protein Rsub_07941 [Raphidocelis subcapitata]|eukprot:GBF95226.1 hypothetical protein Rsub_07941 [Raphidocelis subcapitata]